MSENGYNKSHRIPVPYEVMLSLTKTREYLNTLRDRNMLSIVPIPVVNDWYDGKLIDLHIPFMEKLSQYVKRLPSDSYARLHNRLMPMRFGEDMEAYTSALLIEADLRYGNDYSQHFYNAYGVNKRHGKYLAEIFIPAGRSFQVRDKDGSQLTTMIALPIVADYVKHEFIIPFSTYERYHPRFMANFFGFLSDEPKLFYELAPSWVFSFSADEFMEARKIPFYMLLNNRLLFEG